MSDDLDIKALRTARGWTQDQMADHFGVDKATVWRWENEGVPTRGASRKALEREFDALPRDAPPPSTEAA